MTASSKGDRFDKRRRGARWQRIRRYLLALLALGLAGGAVWLVWFSHVLTVQKVDVVGVTTLPQRAVRDQAAAPMGLQLARANTEAMAIRVARMERIRSVHVTRRWPTTVRIEVQERQPVAWVMSDAEVRQVDRDGVDFRTLSRKPKSLLEIRIETLDPRRRQQALESSARVITYLRVHGRDLYADILRVAAGSQDSVRLELDRGRTVVWGSVAHQGQKLAVARVLLHKVRAQRYDVSAPEQPTTKSAPKK